MDQKPSAFPRADEVVRRYRESGTSTYVGTRALFPHLPTHEAVAAAGVDYIYLDGQHGPVTLQDIWTLGSALAKYGTLLLARISSHSSEDIGTVLDAGAHGVIVPDVRTAAEAEAAVAAVRYPLRGTRSWGAYSYDYAGYSGPPARTEPPLCLVMIESEEGVRNAHEITAVAGVDGIYLGRYDLALSYGEPVESMLPGGTRHDTVATVVEACQSQGIRLATTGAVDSLREEGFTMVTLGSELDLLRVGLNALVERPVTKK